MTVASKAGNRSEPNTEITVVRSILDIPEAQWTALGGVGYSGWRWLKTVEESAIADLSPRHLIIWSGGEIVGLAPCYLQHGELLYTVGDRFISGKLKWLLKRIGISLEPGLYCYAPLTAHTDLLAGEKPMETGMVQALASALEGACATEGIDLFGFPYLKDRDTAARAFLRKSGFSEMSFLPHAVLDLTWESFDHYLDDMHRRSNNLYKTIRREINRTRKAGFRIGKERNIGRHAEAFSRMSANLFAKYHIRNRCVPARFFSLLQKNMEAGVTLVTASAGDRPVGFALFVTDGDEWHFFTAGFDYQRTEGTMVFFSLVFYEPIRLAIEKGICRINYGIASYTPKLRRGCRLEPITLMIACRNARKKLVFETAARMARRRYARYG